MELYQPLIVYKQEHHESTTVPFNYEKDLTLGHWVFHQRTSRNNNHRLVQDHYSLFDAMDFDLGTMEIRHNRTQLGWITYQRLVAYKQQHTPTHISARDQEDPQLGLWVTTQRRDSSTKNYHDRTLSTVDFAGISMECARTSGTAAQSCTAAAAAAGPYRNTINPVGRSNHWNTTTQQYCCRRR